MKTITKKQFAQFPENVWTVKHVRKMLESLDGLRIVAADGFGHYTIRFDGLYLADGTCCEGKNLWSHLVDYIVDEKTAYDLLEEIDWDGDAVRALECFDLLAQPLPRLRRNNFQVDTAIAYVKNEMGRKETPLSSTHIDNEALVLFTGDLCIAVRGSEVTDETGADDFYRNL